MLNVRPLTDELQKIANEELNEVEKRIPEDIAALRAWIEKQPHLRARTDDQYLITYLRGCKYSLEKAKTKIDFFYTIRTMVPELFANNTLDDNIKEICHSGCFVRLPKPLGPAGPRIHFTNFSKLNTKKFTLVDFYRYQCMTMEMYFDLDDNCIVSGYIEVLDFSNISLSLILQYDPMLVKKLIVLAEKGSAVRVKGVHIINIPKEAYTIANLCRSLLSEKLRQRYFVHKNLEELYTHIPKEYLPIEYGGTNGSIPEIQVEHEKQLVQYNEKLIANSKYGVDEKLRPGKKVDKNSLFGSDGSFRKLEID